MNQTRVGMAANAVSMLTANSLALAQRDSKVAGAREKQVIIDELFVYPANVWTKKCFQRIRGIYSASLLKDSKIDYTSQRIS